ncbi:MULTISPECIES: Rid family hydrolase [Phyllobacteriaceae]|uniref:Rid family hydrolase n=1 Tax=Phyllobacteriaceae TaxID=69277 RepID=UPI001FE6A859|nr:MULTISPECIES: Rid family hydrolase [Mesorhizobium]
MSSKDWLDTGSLLAIRYSEMQFEPMPAGANQMSEALIIDRSKGVAAGRSSGSGFGNLVWAVATSDDKSLDLKGQVAAAFAKIDRVLGELGTDRRNLLSVTVFLANLDDKKAFDIEWLSWVGDNPGHWPQRMCIGATLSAGTLVEISVVAARPG